MESETDSGSGRVRGKMDTLFSGSFDAIRFSWILCTNRFALWLIGVGVILVVLGNLGSYIASTTIIGPILSLLVPTTDNVVAYEDTWGGEQLKFARPIPTVISEVGPDAIMDAWTTLLQHEPEIAWAIKPAVDVTYDKAVALEVFNENFIDDMEARTITQYRALMRLRTDIKRVLSQHKLSKNNQSLWGWLSWSNQQNLRREADQQFEKFLKTVDSINEGRRTERNALHILFKNLDKRGNVPSICEGMKSMAFEEAKSPALKDFSLSTTTICFTQARMITQWHAVSEAVHKVTKFVRHLRHEYTGFRTELETSETTEEAILDGVQDLLHELEVLAAL